MHQVVNFPSQNKSGSRPKTCASCGTAFVSRKPWQTFCSHRCRQTALRARQTRVTHGMVCPSGAAKIIAVRPNRSENLQQNQHAFRPQNQGVRAPRHVVEAEVFGGRKWRSIISSNGVVCEVSTLRKRALRDGGAS